MNDNRLKHKLLKILSKQYVVSGFENTENTEIGLNDDVLLPLLKISVEKYELLKMSPTSARLSMFSGARLQRVPT
jgi:hypothetical protein